MPWLTGTAFLHSIMIQERRGMLKIWNVSLVIGTFVLALLGTFLVRSGILQSIHAFGESTLGGPFLAFIALILVGSVALVISRRPDLQPEARFDSLWSREAIFLLNNLVLVALCGFIFWGTFFPLISEALTGTAENLGPPWFGLVVTPLAIVLVLLSGIGPVIAWRRATVANLRRSFLFPVVMAVVVLLVLAFLTPAASSVTSLIMFTFIAFTVAVVIQEFWRGSAARRDMTGEARPLALVRLVGRNRRRYGGYLVHVGIAVMMLGVAASSAFADQQDARLSPGQSMTAGDYRITYREPTAEVLGDRSGTGAPITLGAVLDVQRGDERFTVRPSRNYYAGGDTGPISRFFEGEATSEVIVRWGILGDFWAAVQPDIQALQGPDRRGRGALCQVLEPGPGHGDQGDRPVLCHRPAAGGLPRDRHADGGLDLARRGHRDDGRPHRPMAGRLGPAAPLERVRGSPRARAGTRVAARGPRPSGLGRGARSPSWRRSCSGPGSLRAPTRAAPTSAARSSRRPRRPSTARSATCSWTTPPGSSRTRTTGRPTASCGSRRSRSSSASTSSDEAVRAGHPVLLTTSCHS